MCNALVYLRIWPESPNLTVRQLQAGVGQWATLRWDFGQTHAIAHFNSSDGKWWHMNAGYFRSFVHVFRRARPNPDIAFWDHSKSKHPSTQLFSPGTTGHIHFIGLYKSIWNFMVIWGEFPGSCNRGSDWCSITAFLWRTWDLGQMAEVRKCSAGMERVEKWHTSSILFCSSSPPSFHSSQTGSQLGCELKREEASFFL